MNKEKFDAFLEKVSHENKTNNGLSSDALAEIFEKRINQIRESEKKIQAFNKNKVENYKASCRLEGLTVEATPHPELHNRYEIRSKWSEYLEASQELEKAMNECHSTTNN